MNQCALRCPSCRWLHDAPCPLPVDEAMLLAATFAGDATFLGEWLATIAEIAPAAALHSNGRIKHLQAALEKARVRDAASPLLESQHVPREIEHRNLTPSPRDLCVFVRRI